MSAVAAPASPYKGLASFSEEGLDPMLFFGREREVEMIVANLVASRLTILYGPSGVGKTSVLGAGVAPRLRELEADVVVVSAWSSGADFDAPSSNRQRYLLLDQIEEYFLYHDAEGPLAEVAAILRDREARVNVLISVREDALAQLDVFKGRIPGLFANSLRLDRLDRASGRRAITGPLERYRELAASEGPTRVEPALVEELLDSVAAGRIQLGPGLGGTAGTEEGGRIEAPFLQLVLERLWAAERDEGSDVLRLETLRGLGGARRIVEEHLERAMAGLSDEDKDAAAAIYNHLVTPSGTKIAHRAGDLARYASVDEQEATRVLGHLTGERILRAADDGAAGPQYEIFHDVLADAVLGWRTRHEADRRIDETRREAQARHRRVLGLAAGALLAVAVLAGIAVYALSQRSAARENARQARAGELVAQAAAALPADAQRSLELALDASRIGRSPSVEDALRKALRQLRGISATSLPRSAGEPVLGADGSSVALATGDTVGVYRAENRLQLTLRHPKVESAALSRDGSRIATVGRDGAARIWTRHGRLLQQLPHRGQVQWAAFSDDGGRLATVSQQRVVSVFDRRGRLTTRFAQPGRVMSVRFARDGNTIATGSSDDTARLWGARTGKLRRTLRGHVGRVGDVAFSRDGTLLATGSTDGTARVWNVGTGSLVTVFPGHDNAVSRVEFSPDGTLLATGSRDRKARIFEAASPTLRGTLAGHDGPVVDLAWSPDGSKLITAAEGGAVRQWDGRRFPVLRLMRTEPDEVGYVRFGEAGQIVSWPDSPRDPRVAVSEQLMEAIGPGSEALAVSPDGQFVVSGDALGGVRLWDARSRTAVRTLPAHRAGVTSARFSPDGRRVVTTGLDHDVRVSDAATGRQIWVLSHSALVSDADFSADGRWIGVAGPGEAGILDAESGERVLLVDGREPILASVDFSPTGWRLATGGPSGAVRTYDCRICGGIDELITLAEARLARLR